MGVDSTLQNTTTSTIRTYKILQYLLLLRILVRDNYSYFLHYEHLPEIGKIKLCNALAGTSKPFHCYRFLVCGLLFHLAPKKLKVLSF